MGGCGSSKSTKVMKIEELAKVVFVLGGPGCGKGTQCQLLVERKGFVHLSAGDLLREEQQTDSDDSKLIKEYIEEGKIVPVEITWRLLRKAMEKNGIDKWFLIDGFPRNRNNYDGWNHEMADYAIVKKVLFFELSEEIMKQRILKRAETSGRADDNEESMIKRFKTFQTETIPVIDLFEKQKKVLRIDASGEIEEIYKEVQSGLII